MKIIGHRGARKLAPDNTLEGFQKAIDAGVDGIECDVRVTSDGQVIMAHDATIGDAVIANTNYADLLKLEPTIITLETTINYINRAVPLYIELKPGVAPQPVIDDIHSFCKTKPWELDDFIFVSFDYKILRALRAAFPEAQLVVNDMWSGVRACLRARKLKTTKIDLYSKVVWTGFIRGVSKRGFELYTFPLNDLEQAKRWHQAGLTGIITDDPRPFKAID